MIWGKGKNNKATSRKRPKLDYAELQWALLAMNQDWKLFKMVKKEMQRRGQWKAKGRGRPFDEGYDPRRGVGR
jgi:hypothetical protein